MLTKSTEEVVADLEKKVDRLEAALECLLDSLTLKVSIPYEVAIAAGMAQNVLSGVE